MNFKKGDKVEQILPTPVVGEVVSFALCQETGEVTLNVSWQDADGSAHQRSFKAAELKVVAE
jgi:hypothetical protein